jgi:hypothetical protein
MLTEEAKRSILLRSKARAFAQEVKKQNLALKIPEEVVDWLKDEEILPFFDHLFSFGLQKRKDFFWEERKQ